MRTKGFRLALLVFMASSLALTARGTGEERVSLLVLDLDGDGLHLADRYYAVVVDLDGDGVSECVTWTAAGHDEAILWVDRDGSGELGEGEILLREEPRAFEVLERLDRPEHGGNDDGFLSPRDREWSRIGLWIDRNHDGRATLRELSRLRDWDLLAIDLERRDQVRIDGGLNLQLGWLSVWRRGKAGALVRLRLSEVRFELLASGCDHTS